MFLIKDLFLKTKLLFSFDTKPISYDHFREPLKFSSLIWWIGHKRLRLQKVDSIQYKFWQIFLCVDSCWITRISWSIYTYVGKRAPYLFFKACLLCAPPLSSTLRFLRNTHLCEYKSFALICKCNKKQLKKVYWVQSIVEKIFIKKIQWKT